MDYSCTVYKTVDIVAKKWSLLIILSMYKGNGKLRYSEIKKDLKTITPKILSSRLKDLKEEKIVKKEIDSSSVPIKTYYSLTNSGIDLVKIIQDIKKWGLKWKIKNKVCEATFCKHCNL